MSLLDTTKRLAVVFGALLVATLAWGTSDALAQDETSLSIETERAQSEEAVDVPVQVTDFNNVGSISLTINYDSEVVSFPSGDVSTGDLISGEPRSGFSASRPEPGELRISFFDPQGNTIDLGDGTLFNITFSNFAGGTGDITVDESNSEIADGQADAIPVTFRNGAVVDQDAGTVSVGSVTGATLNETVSVPLSGQDLQEVGSASFEIGFDTSALRFEGVANDQSGLGLEGNVTENGNVRIAGQSAEGGSLGDSFAEVEFTFLGGSPVLDFLVSSEVTDLQANVLPAEFTDGSVAGDVPVVSFPDRGVGAGETISVPVQAEDLREVGAVTLETTYDPSVLTFEDSEEGFAALDVSNPSDGIVRISGQSSSGIDPSSNDDKFINLRFSVGQGLGSGTESVLGFNAEESELASIDAEPYNTAFESGLVRVEDTEIAVSADSVSYDVTAIDSTSGRVVTVTNESDSVATLEGEISGPEAPFSIASGGGPFTLEPGESQDVTVNYSPVEVSNPDRDTLSISHNADNEESPFEVPLAGQAEAPSIAASVAPDTAAVRSGEELALTQTVANEATDAAVLEVEVTGVPDFLALEGASVTSGDGTVDGQALTLQPGAEAELEYSFQESVDTTTVFGGAIVHQTNDPDAASPLEIPVEITAEAVQVALNAQSLDLTAGDTELRVEDVIANQGDTVVITTDDGDGDFSDEEIAGSTPVEEDLDGEDVLVDVEGASPVDHAAHVSTDGTVSGVVATSDRAPVYATAQFDFSDETSVGPAETVTVDSVRVLYNGSVGRDTISINLHEASGGEITGEFVGISQEDLAVNETHEEVAVDVIEPISPPAESPQRTESTIVETGEFFAMAHLGPAGTGADGGRVPVGGAQQPPLQTTASPGVIGDFATVTVERERGVALNPQSLDLTAGDTELRIDSVIANAGDAVVVTTDDGDGDFTDEEVVGSTTLEENVNGGEVLVDVEGADPVDHAAHVSTDGTVSGVVATSDRAPVYATAQFDWQDENSVGPAETVSVDAVEILYQGEVGRDTISVNLHEASGGEITGDFIGISQEDLAVNVVHEEIAIDVIEPISPPAESPQRTESTIVETGEFFAMAHLGPAGTGADGGRVPVGGAQQPPLRTTASPGVIGDFATVTVEAADLNVSVSRGFEGGASDPADYELVAIPGSTGVDVAETVTGDRGTNWRAFLETGGSGGDGSLQSYGDEAFGFRAGRGVWVLAQNGWSFEGTVPAVSAADGTPSVPLQDGWNAISNPLQEDLVWADVRDASGLSEALFRWTGEGGFQSVDTLRSAQESGEAYYTLNNEGADSLELSSAGPNSTLAANTAAESRSNASPRTVKLSATADGKGMTSTVTVGMNPSAEEASSYRAPPAHFGGTALRIRDGDPVKSFMRMVAATDAETSQFDLSLQAEPGTSVEISAGDLPKNAGPGFGVVLVDGGDTYDLRDGPATVTVGENSGSAGFQVRLGDAEKIAQQTAPDKTRLRANYPNPFSEQTTIEYDLAEQSEVNIRVYNVLGQQVAMLAQGTKQAGTYKIDWSGQNLSSGKYFVRLEAGGTADTKQVTVVR